MGPVWHLRHRGGRPAAAPHYRCRLSPSPPPLTAPYTFSLHPPPPFASEHQQHGPGNNDRGSFTAKPLRPLPPRRHHWETFWLQSQSAVSRTPSCRNNLNTPRHQSHIPAGNSGLERHSPSNLLQPALFRTTYSSLPASISLTCGAPQYRSDLTTMRVGLPCCTQRPNCGQTCCHIAHRSSTLPILPW